VSVTEESESKNVEDRKNLLTGRASYKLTTLVQRASRQTWVNTGHSPGPFLEAREYVILLSQAPIGLPQSS
jgi:hypothetical protein